MMAATMSAAPVTRPGKFNADSRSATPKQPSTMVVSRRTSRLKAMQTGDFLYLASVRCAR